MRGHTKIELFNAETGKREAVYEKDNLVTNAVKYVLAFCNKINRVPSDWVFTLCTNALGGIMLFDDTLEEDPENIEFPSDAHIVGYSDRSLNTSNPQRGSFNSLESFSTDDGYTAVWDFGTSQANGTIKCVCLTSNFAGYNPYLRYFRGDRYPITFRNSPTDPTSYKPLRHDGTYMYYLHSGNARIYKSKFNPFKIDSVHNGVGIGNQMLEQVADVSSIPDGLYDISPDRDVRYWHDGEDGYLYVIWFNWSTYDYSHRPYYSSGNRISICKVKYEDDSYDIIEEEVVTLAGASLMELYGGSGTTNYAYGVNATSNGYLYWVGSDNKSIYIINLHNTADVQRIEVAGENESNIRIQARLRPCLKGDGIMFGYLFRKPNDTTDYTRWGIIRHDGLITKSAETGGPSYDIYDKKQFAKVCGVANGDYYSSPYTYSGEVVAMAAYLGTINNLPSPIVKTASQTMKVTYTLTDVEENNG